MPVATRSWRNVLTRTMGSAGAPGRSALSCRDRTYLRWVCKVASEQDQAGVSALVAMFPVRLCKMTSSRQVREECQMFPNPVSGHGGAGGVVESVVASAPRGARLRGEIVIGPRPGASLPPAPRSPRSHSWVGPRPLPGIRGVGQRLGPGSPPHPRRWSAVVPRPGLADRSLVHPDMTGATGELVI